MAAVRGAMTSAVAMRALVQPSTSRPRISSSRWVSPRRSPGAPPPPPPPGGAELGRAGKHRDPDVPVGRVRPGERAQEHCVRASGG
jgi:hypothetical protein